VDCRITSRRRFLGQCSAAVLASGAARAAETPAAKGPAKLIYANDLARPKDVKGFVLEGQANVSFPAGRMRLENVLAAKLGQTSNFVYWCPVDLPADFVATWNFWPLREPGLCMLFFAAAGRKGEDLFDPRLARRSGEYAQYHHGDINALHVSYFRRSNATERAFHTCNLRKSYGFQLVCQGADPIPSVADAVAPYRMQLIKHGGSVVFAVNELEVFVWVDDGKKYGPVLGGGKIGFRQMAPLAAEYADLKITDVLR
jgi:hypothetical protein